MSESEQVKKRVTEMFDQISSVYDVTNKIISFGTDKLWRKSLLKQIPLLEDQTLVDLATGTGEQILALGNSPFIGKFYGFDLSTNMLLLGQKKIARKGLKKKTLLQIGNALSVPVANEFCDLTSISFGIRNTTEPLKCLSEMHRILKSKGLCFILEFSLPKSKIIRSLYLFYLRHILPKIGYLISKNREAYSYLNKTIESFPSGEAFLQMMKSAGFSSCKLFPLSFGIVSLYVGKKN